MKNIDKLFDFNNLLVEKILFDHSTDKNIVWATDMYSDYGSSYKNNKQMFKEDIIYLINKKVLVPRIMKTKIQQQERSKDKAEVFTPSWVINKMNNYCDEQWFGKKNVFNVEKEDNTWTSQKGKIEFLYKNDWKEYVCSKRIEITCGEAPYVVSRYDVTTGKKLPLNNRIGILDRKIRVVSENTNNKKTWLQWVYKAFESVYGYEYQGDSLLFARINLAQTFIDYYEDRFNEYPEKRMIDKIIDIISWNFWQMDGLKESSPTGMPPDRIEQLSLDNLFDYDSNEEKNNDLVFCKIKDWNTNCVMEYKSLKKEDD